MVIMTPPGVYTMQAKRSIIKVNAVLYHRAARKLKTQILDDLFKTTHLNRKHLTVLLNKTGKVYYTPQGIKLIGDPTVTYMHKRGRKKTYTEELVPYLEILWEWSGYRSSIHLQSFIRAHKALLYETPTALASFTPMMQAQVRKVLGAPPVVKEKLLMMSTATIDRLLKVTKEKCRLAHKYRPHPHASVIKKKIPVESYFDKPKNGPIGYTELDLVHHCGSDPRGGFCYTLSAVEINTAWTELRVLRNKAQTWTHKALVDIERAVPFRIHSQHVDNGPEFINAHIYNYTQERGIRYTRSRDYHKNDAPYVESRHFTTVRSFVGYRRYDTEPEYRILKKLMPMISIKHNYFMPTMKLIKKMRIGGKVRKKYEINIPLNRVLRVAEVSAEKKDELCEYKTSLSYLKLIDEIHRLQKHLDTAYHAKHNNLWKDYEE